METQVIETSDSPFQLLLEQTTSMYNSEREFTRRFKILQFDTTDVALKENMAREVVENRIRCARLEGLLAVLDQNSFENDTVERRDKPANKIFIQQFSTMLKRVVWRHADFGYKTAIFVALAFGQNEIAAFLRICLGSYSNIK